MSLSLGSRLAGSCLFVVAVVFSLIGNSAYAQNQPPKFESVSLITPIEEYGETMLVCTVSDPNRNDILRLKITWGDGGVENTFSLTNISTSLTNYHFYVDRVRTNKPNDIYTISLKLTDGRAQGGFFYPKGGAASTNLVITVTNVVRLTMNANSPVVAGAPATERALQFSQFKLPSPGAFPFAMTRGPDGEVWFTEVGANKIGRITAKGTIQEFPVSGAIGFAGICTGPDNKLWFTCFDSDKIGRITTNGTVRLFNIPHPTGPLRSPWGIAPGPDGNSVWFVGWGYRLSQMNLNGGIVEEHLHDAGHNFHNVAVGPDNALWYTDWSWDMIHRYDPASGAYTNYFLEYLATPRGIVRGPDDAMWFTQYQLGKIGRISLDGQLSEASLDDTLPWAITAGPDGAMWFTEKRNTNCNVVRLKLNGEIQRFALPYFADPGEIVAAHGDSVWFTLSGRNRIGRLRYMELGNVVLHINIQDSPNDRHTLVFDWGDGSAPIPVVLPAGQRTYSAAHTYMAPGSYSVYVSARDDDGTVAEATQVVEVLAAGANVRDLRSEQNTRGFPAFPTRSLPPTEFDSAEEDSQPVEIPEE